MPDHMQSSMRETWFLLISIPLYSILITAEIILSNWKTNKFYTIKDSLENVYLTLINAGLDLALRWLFYVSILMWSYNRHVFRIENPYAYWVLLFFLEDLAFYVEHRIDHYCRLFWAVHVTHHSSEEFNLTTGFRSSVFQPVYRFVYFIPLAFMGFHPLDIVFMYSITQAYGILVHTRYIQRMPSWFEAIFVSPSHHRVHHASNIRYLDKNMGMCLIIWDKMFGTFQEELPTDPVRYGLTTPIGSSRKPLTVIFHEWAKMAGDVRKSNSASTMLKYIFKAPGWSHDGSSKTAEELRRSLQSKADI